MEFKNKVKKRKREKIKRFYIKVTDVYLKLSYTS